MAPEYLHKTELNNHNNGINIRGGVSLCTKNLVSTNTMYIIAEQHTCMLSFLVCSPFFFFLLRPKDSFSAYSPLMTVS